MKDWGHRYAQNTVAFSKGVADAGKGMVKGVETLVTNPQVVVGAMRAAYEAEGGGFMGAAAAFNVVNPAAALMRSTQCTIEKVQAGDARGSGECYANMAMDASAFVLPAMKSLSSAPDLAVDLGRGATSAVDGMRAANIAETVAKGSDELAEAASSGRRAAGAAKAADDVPTSALACSFVGPTLVLMADGTKKAIEDVEAGDLVLATDPETGDTIAGEVTHLWVHEDTVIDLHVDGDVVTTTEDHPFWNATDREWQRADQLDVGDRVLGADGELLEVQGLDRRSVRAATAYNLTVDGIHTYFVGVGEDTALVHNTCGGSLSGNVQLASDGAGSSRYLYRTGSRTDQALTDTSGVSFRDSISSSADRVQTFDPGAKIYAVDSELLPPGAVVRDGVPAGHVSVTATPEQIRNAIVTRSSPLESVGLKPLDEPGAFRVPKK